MSLLIAGTHSGVGKTTITLALLAVCRSQGLSVQSFKVGPDYIDPMFHREITGLPCRNLDPILTSPKYVQNHFDRYSQGKGAVIIEGVMGLFDGMNASGEGSTAAVAKLLNLPVVLVVDCAHLSQSIGALLYGFLNFDREVNIAGVILNRVASDRHRQFLEEAVEAIGIPIWGVWQRHPDLELPSRHLGLVPAGELTGISSLTDRLCNLGKQFLDWEKIIPYLSPQASFSVSPVPPEPIFPPPRIALARDAAFNFYYPENLEALVEAGAELVPWSPLTDPFPQEVQGMYFGGGFPEVFIEALAANEVALAGIRQHSHLPIYAECGGLIYLSHSLTLEGDRVFPLVGLVPTEVKMGKRLMLGYRRLESDHGWLTSKEPLWGHEFHYSFATTSSLEPLYTLWDSRGTFIARSGWHIGQTVASYIHLHWGDKPTIPWNFVKSCSSTIGSIYS